MSDRDNIYDENKTESENAAYLVEMREYYYHP